MQVAYGVKGILHFSVCGWLRRCNCEGIFRRETWIWSRRNNEKDVFIEAFIKTVANTILEVEIFNKRRVHQLIKGTGTRRHLGTNAKRLTTTDHDHSK